MQTNVNLLQKIVPPSTHLRLKQVGLNHQATPVNNTALDSSTTPSENEVAMPPFTACVGSLKGTSDDPVRRTRAAAGGAPIPWTLMSLTVIVFTAVLAPTTAVQIADCPCPATCGIIVQYSEPPKL